jgi:hypothetical protein
MGVYGTYFGDDKPEHYGNDMGHDVEFEENCRTERIDWVLCGSG